MARKQETPASTAEAMTPVSTVDSNGGPPEAAGSPLSPGGALVPVAGAAGNSGAASGSAENSTLVAAERQVVPSTGPGVVAGEQDTSAGIAATYAAAPEGASRAASTLADSSAGDDELTREEQAKPNPAALQIYPLRSYMDEGELRRRGGPAYTVPRRHAEELVQRNLASFEPLKE